jgi:hypothetical protein
MTSQATNRREGVSRLHASNKKELETARAVLELLGVPTIGGGITSLGVVVRGVKEVK